MKSYYRFSLVAICFSLLPSLGYASILGDGVAIISTDMTTDLEACEPAEANAYRALCSRFITEQGAIECIRTARDRYFDQCALDLCGRFNSEQGALSCLRVTRDKRFQVDEIQFCGRFNTEQGAVGCLDVSGARESDPFKTELLERLDAVQELIEGERLNAAQRELDDLINWVERSK